MTGELLATVAFAIGAGAATFFAPCAYALLPGYVGFYAASVRGETVPLSGALARGGAAAAGVGATFLALSALALAAGELLERVLPVVEPLVGVALVVFGLALLSGRQRVLHVALPKRRRSVWGFAVFGGLYALAATACVLPLFLGLAVQSLSMPAHESALSLGTYGGTVAVLMLGTTVATAVGHDLGAERIAGAADQLVKLGGVLLVLAGLGQMYVALA